MLKLSKKQTIAFDLLEENKEVTEVLYGGAAGGGKSFFGCAWQIYRRLTFAGTRGLIGRSQLKNLKLTTLKTFFDVAKDIFSLKEGEDYDYRPNEGLIRFVNGSEIILKDLFLYPKDPDFASLGSMEITDAFIDEATEITQKAFEIVNSRIRYKLHLVGGVPKMLLASNPAHCWVKWRFVLDKNNTPVHLKPFQRFISANVDDNPDNVFRTLYKGQLNKLNAYDKARLLQGDWIVNKNEQPFFYEFDRNRHVASKQFHLIHDEPVWLSFDFNLQPTTCIVGQIIHGEGLRVYKTHQVDGGTRKLCQELKQYMEYIIKVTGDRSGSSGHTAAGTLPGGQLNTDYNIIMDELELSQYSLIDTRSANKKHIHSRELCNSVLFRLPLIINPVGCEALINDIETAQPKPDGRLLKDRQNHKQDAGDAFRYLINGWFLNGMRDIKTFENLLP